MPQELQNYELVERVRQAVIKLGGTVTIGDVMSVTGLGNYEAKEGLDNLIKTHEGTMRVSEKGEIQYAFARGCVLRDQRSWWQRNKKQVMKVVKAIFKVIIMLVLVIYFIIYLIILLALLTSNNRSSDRLDIGGVWFFFWGSGSPGNSTRRKAPLYTRVYNFVFGPEEEELDPLEGRTKCAQLIRAKNGVITVEDWIVISGQTREKCASDLARYTVEFDGSAEITENGTLVYVFEDMMKTARQKRAKPDPIPECSWKMLEQPRPLSGNTEEDGGNGAVIGLNLFNLVMSGIILFGVHSMLNDPDNLEVQLDPATMESFENISFWLGIFPFIFSSLIFLGPLVRLPGNNRENRERRERNVRKAVLGAIFDQNSGHSDLTLEQITARASRICSVNSLPAVSYEESRTAMNLLTSELGGDLNFETQKYKFDSMDTRLADAQKERADRRLDRQDAGRVVFSTDNQEQEKIEDENVRAEMDEFEKMLHSGGSNFTPSHGRGDYGSSYSGSGSSSSKGNYSSGSGY